MDSDHSTGAGGEGQPANSSERRLRQIREWHRESRTQNYTYVSNGDVIADLLAIIEERDAVLAAARRAGAEEIEAKAADFATLLSIEPCTSGGRCDLRSITTQRCPACRIKHNWQVVVGITPSVVATLPLDPSEEQP